MNVCQTRYMKKNFTIRARTLRRKMSDYSFDQSGDGPTPEQLLAKGLEKAYTEGVTDTLTAVMEGIANENRRKEK